MKKKWIKFDFLLISEALQGYYPLVCYVNYHFLGENLIFVVRYYDRDTWQLKEFNRCFAKKVLQNVNMGIEDFIVRSLLRDIERFEGAKK